MQSTLDTIIQECIDNVNPTLSVYAVEVISEGVFKLWATNTYYLTVNYNLTLGGDLYIVTDFLQDTWVQVERKDHVNSPAVLDYQLDDPLYIWGRFNQVNVEIKGKKEYGFKPFIWRFDLEPRTINYGDEMNISVGNTRLFFAYPTNVKKYTTSTDYTNVLDPLQGYVNQFITQLKKHRLVGRLTTSTNIKHPKFLTSNGSVGNEETSFVFGKYISAVEVTINFPIRRDLTCRTRFIPVVEGNGFSSGFSDGFK